MSVALLDAFTNAPPAVTPPAPNATAYRFALGRFAAHVVGDGQARFPAFPAYAPNATHAQVEAALRGAFLPPRDYLLQCNALVVDTGRHRVLVDAGAGTELGPDLGHLAAHLAAAGLPPASVDVLVLTHGHLDHLGGVVTPDGAPAFPNAHVFVPESEWRFWSDPALAPAALPMGAEFGARFLAAARRTFDAVGGRVTRYRAGREPAELVPGVHAVALPGHTPGHHGVLVTDGDAQLLHAADVFHHPAFDLAHPDWQTAFDHDAAEAARTRRRVLDRAAADRALLMSYHMPFPALGHVRALPGPGARAYTWEPAPWHFAAEAAP